MIFIEPINQKWDAGVEIIEDEKELKEFQQWIARNYKMEVQKRVALGYISDKLAPLSPNYLKYKLENNLYPHQWIATGELISHLTLKGKSKLVIGFDNRKKHKGSNMSYTKLARILEYGTYKIPPRPVMRLVYINMRKQISRWYKLYKIETGVI